MTPAAFLPCTTWRDLAFIAWLLLAGGCVGEERQGFATPTDAAQVLSDHGEAPDLATHDQAPQDAAQPPDLATPPERRLRRPSGPGRP